MKTLILILVSVLIFYEFIEHVLFPLFWYLIQRKKKSSCGPGRILGNVGIVKEWQNNEGYVFVDGELWKAVSRGPLKPGNKVVVHQMEGLTLTVHLQSPNPESP